MASEHIDPCEAVKLWYDILDLRNITKLSSEIIYKYSIESKCI